jgi:hypothetical protein
MLTAVDWSHRQAVCIKLFFVGKPDGMEGVSWRVG